MARYESLTPGQKKEFDAGYDEWLKSTGQTEMPSESKAVDMERIFRESRQRMDLELPGGRTEPGLMNDSPLWILNERAATQTYLSSQDILKMNELLLQHMQDLHEEYVMEWSEASLVSQAAELKESGHLEEYMEQNGEDCFGQVTRNLLNEGADEKTLYETAENMNMANDMRMAEGVRRVYEDAYNMEYFDLKSLPMKTRGYGCHEVKQLLSDKTKADLGEDYAKYVQERFQEDVKQMAENAKARNAREASQEAQDGLFGIDLTKSTSAGEKSQEMAHTAERMVMQERTAEVKKPSRALPNYQGPENTDDMDFTRRGLGED